MADIEKAYQESRKLYQKVLEILKKNPTPHILTERDIKDLLNAPYPPGVVWHRDPDPYITRRLRENLSFPNHKL